MNFSVIVPVFNGEIFLSDCLSSLTRQGFVENFHEVLIIDDGSTDSSSEIASQYCNKYPYFKLIQTKNHGVSAARNAGILHSSGKYITFMDADDMFADNSYLPLLKTAQDNQLDLIKFGHTQQKSKFESLAQTEEEHKFYNNFCSTSVCDQIYKKSIIIEHNILFIENQAGMEDYTFNFKYSHYVKNGCGIYFSKLYYYRINPNSNTESIKQSSPEIREKALRRAFDGSFVALKEVKNFIEDNNFEKDGFYDGAIAACMQTHLMMSVFLKEKPNKTISNLNTIGLSLRDLKIKNIEGPSKREKLKSEIMFLMRHKSFFKLFSFVYSVIK